MNSGILYFGNRGSTYRVDHVEAGYRTFVPKLQYVLFSTALEYELKRRDEVQIVPLECR